MKNKFSVLMMLLLASVMVLAACGGGAVDTPEQADESSEVETSKTPVSTGTEGATDAGEGEVVTMYVGPELAECTGAGPQTCMLVKYSPDEEYQYFYSPIEGFDYEPGYDYELEVLVTPVENPPADGSSLQYTLVDEVSKTPAGTEASTLPAATEGDAALTGTYWTLTSYSDADGNMVDVLPETEVTAVFGEDGTVSGNASCNTYNASYEVDGSSITIGVGMSTMMACLGEGVMEQETAYLAALTTAAAYSIQGDVLELRTTDGALAVSYTATEPVTLTATPWLVTSHNNGRGGAVSSILGTELTLEFMDDGNITGNAGCNRYFGPYVVDGDAIHIGPLATTRAFCPKSEGIMEQEQEFLTALQSAATYSIRDDKLDLRTVKGSIAVIAIPGTPTLHEN